MPRTASWPCKPLFVSDSGSITLSGDARIDTPLLTASSGATFKLGAAGAMDLVASTALQEGVTAPVGLGSALHISASRLNLDTSMVLPAGIVTLTADGEDAADGISLGAGARIDVRGVDRIFDGQHVMASGGSVGLKSVAGNIATTQSSTIDVSSFDGKGSAGRLTLSAAAGELDLLGSIFGQGAAGATGGEFVVDAKVLPDLGLLNQTLNLGGFTAVRDFRQRGEGDITLASASDKVIKASNVRIAADQGSILLDGTVDASGTSGGTVRLIASDDVKIAGSILANGTQGDGGRVTLESDHGSILLQGTPVVDVRGTSDGGTVDLRLARDALLTVNDGIDGNERIGLAGIVGASEVTLEGFQRYTSSGTITRGQRSGQQHESLVPGRGELHDECGCHRVGAEPIGFAQSACRPRHRDPVERQSQHDRAGLEPECVALQRRARGADVACCRATCR